MGIIKLQGKQYLVREGQELVVPHLKLKEGERFVAKDIINNQEYHLVVIRHKRGPKIRVIKFRRKTRYKRTLGYRDWQTIVKVEEPKQEKPLKPKAVIDKKPKTTSTVKKVTKKVKNA